MSFTAVLTRIYLVITTMFLIGVIAVWFVPRGDISANADRLPAFDLFSFFDRKTVAYGIFEDRFGNLQRQFRVEIDTNSDGNVLILDERFLYADGEQDRRIWRIEENIIDGDVIYTGRAEDIMGKATGQIVGNTMSWRYEIGLLFSGMEVDVSFDDFIYQIDNDIAINRAYVSKWGLEIGSVTLVFLKDNLADQKLPLDLKNW